MKRIVSVAIAMFMLLALTACGVPQEKLDEVSTKVSELEEKYERLNELVDELDGYQMDLVSTDMHDEVSAMADLVADYRNIADNELESKNAKEVDEIIASLDAELLDANENMPMIEGMVAGISSVMDATVSISELNVRIVELSMMYTEKDPSEEVMAADTVIGEKGALIQEKLGSLENFDSEDYQGLIDLFAEVKKDLEDYGADLNNLIALMEQDLEIAE